LTGRRPAGSAADLVTSGASLPKLREAAATCRACELWRDATQTVFGEGTARADVVLVGEQPGDREDLAGEPFVGPAGRVLDDALERAGIDRRRAYVTNVVKHFRWQAQGKRRIHRKPSMSQISACRPWLDAELDAVRPRAVICLGATAAQALLGKSFKVSRERGKFVDSPLAPVVMATVHPSSILRGGDEDRADNMNAFVADLKRVAGKIYADQ
jgi:uracil-DNA glycosylase family protein